MSTPITATDLARNLSDFLGRVSYRGESFVITRGDRRIAILSPATGVSTGRDLAGLLSRKERLSAAEAESFREDLDESRRLLDSVAVESLWPS